MAEKIYAIGDLHGHSTHLKALLAKLDPGVQKVFLGDYIDRGPDSKGVIELVQAEQAKGAIALKGNHEDLCIRAHKNDPSYADSWILNGGVETLRSFGVLAKEHVAIPKPTLDWMEALPLFYETDEFFFVHAGAYPGSALEASKKNEEVCLWIRDKFIDSDWDWGKVVVFGHTPNRDPILQKNKIGIDTGVFFTGVLTAVLLPDREIIQVALPI